MKIRIIFSTFIFIPMLLSGQTHSILKNIGGGSDYGIPAVNKATTWNGKAYFISLGPGEINNRIWVTDGTGIHTSRILTSDYPDIEYLSSINSGLIFNAWKDTNPGIYKSDGTQTGTFQIKEIPSQDVFFMQALSDSLIIFGTENYSGDSTFLWSTDGTTGGTIKLGLYEIKPSYIEYSFFKNNLIFSEKSTNSNLFPPVITDGTIPGTKLVTDFINDIVPVDISAVETAVGTTDFLFAQTSNGGKVFNGNTVSNFNVGGSDFYHGYKIGRLNAVFLPFDIFVYDSMSASVTTLPVEPNFFTQPIARNGKVYFQSSDGFVYKTDGTALGTKKISSITIGASNFDPYLFATDDLLIYSSDHGSNTELWVVDLATDVDSLFSIIKPAGNPVVAPFAFSINQYLVYPRYTSAQGREYWVYDPIQTGLSEIWPGFKISIAPNPADNELTISLQNYLPVGSVFSIYDILGRRRLHSVIYSGYLKFDISDFAPGQYFLHLDTGKETHFVGTVIKE